MSEEALESSHYDFYRFWLRYLVRDLENPRFLKKHFDAILKFNVAHTPVSTDFPNSGRGSGSLETTDQRGIWEGPQASKIFFRSFS